MELSMLKITNARVIVTCPGRNFVTLKIETDQGVHGIGDATLNGRELAVVSYLQDHVCPALIGRDAHRIEDIWQYLACCSRCWSASWPARSATIRCSSVWRSST
jgi:L-alanine-DL-glutamate epimerase-like enolase superfamily enzyme